MSLVKSITILGIFAPCILWWIALTPLLLLGDWISKLWFGGAIGIVGVWMSAINYNRKSVYGLLATLTMLGIGCVTVGSCIYYTLPISPNDTNWQLPYVYSNLLYIFQFCMAIALVGGLMQFWLTVTNLRQVLSGTNRSKNITNVS